jgi:hypothetical protein
MAICFAGVSWIRDIMLNVRDPHRLEAVTRREVEAARLVATTFAD